MQPRARDRGGQDRPPPAGFGLGFERNIAYVTGLFNVRDVIPFPGTPGNGDVVDPTQRDVSKPRFS